MPKLANAKRERFCQEFIIDLNGKQAAIRSEYSEKTAEQQASRLLSNDKVQQRIAELQQERAERTRVTQDRVVKELALIGFSDLKNYLDIDPDTGSIRAKGFEEMPRDESRALQSIKEDRVIKEDADGRKTTVYDKVSFKTHDKIRALEILAKHLGMLIERHEITGDEGGPIKIEYVLVGEPKKGGSDGKENLEGKAPVEATETAGGEKPK